MMEYAKLTFLFASTGMNVRQEFDKTINNCVKPMSYSRKLEEKYYDEC